MIRLQVPKEPKWLDLGEGVRVRVAPPNAAMRMAVMRDVATADQKLPGGVSDEDRGMALAVAEAAAFARRAVIAWEGVADEDGKPIPAPTPDQAAALMEQSPICCLAFISQYIAPMRELEQEKNVSAPSPSGSSEGADDTAQHVQSHAKNAQGGKTSRKRSKGSKPQT